MEEQLITFETAKLAKEKGFDINTYSQCWVKTLDGAIIHNSERRNIAEHERCEQYLLQPTQSLLQKWLREKYNCFVTITQEFYMDGINFLWQVLIYDKNNEDCSGDYLSPKSSSLYGDNGTYKAYEDALEDGLKHALGKIK
jgi:hypothetical protein